jgi:hypothetical protein
MRKIAFLSCAIFGLLILIQCRKSREPNTIYPCIEFVPYLPQDQIQFIDSLDSDTLSYVCTDTNHTRYCEPGYGCAEGISADFNGNDGSISISNYLTASIIMIRIEYLGWATWCSWDCNRARLDSVTLNGEIYENVRTAIYELPGEKYLPVYYSPNEGIVGFQDTLGMTWNLAR